MLQGAQPLDHGGLVAVVGRTVVAGVRQFVGQAELLEMIGTRYIYARTDAAYDSTSVRYEIPGTGVFGIIANESEPFCSACTRLRRVAASPALWPASTSSSKLPSQRR